MPTTRVKDAGFLQQHIEKLVLAGGALLLVVAFVLFFVLDPFSLKVGGQDYGSPDDAVKTLTGQDAQLKAGLSKENPLEDPEVPNFQKNYEQMMAQSVTSPEQIARLARFGLTDKALNPIIPEPQRYAMVYPPVPKDVEYKFGYDVLDTEFNPDAVARFFELWGRPQTIDEPADFPMIVLAGEFDIWEWVNRLKGESKTAPKGEGTPIPVGIWAKRFGIAGVAILSEEWDEQTQSWTNRRIVEALPGQVRVLPSDKAPANSVAESMAYIEQMRQAREQIAQPELPWVMDFVQITPPGGDELRDGADGFDEFGFELTDENLGPTERRIKALQDKILQLQERMRQRDERVRPDRPDRPVRPGRGGDGFGDGGFDGGFDGGPPDRGTGERRDRLAVQIEEIQAQIEQLRPRADKERDERTRQAEARRLREEEARRAREERRALLEARGGVDPGFDTGGFGLEGVQLEEGATIRVWAADPTMRPGKTYRYKLLVAVINPLYAVPRLEKGQLAENKERAAIFPTAAEIEKMPWIGPITVEPRARFFFTSGNENKAKVEVFRRHNGELQTQNFDVAPGDPIGGKVVIKDKQEIEPDFTVDMNVGAVLVDIEKRRDVRNNTVFTMIFMDESGNLFERSQAYDSNDPARRELQREIKDGPAFELRPDKVEQQFDNFGDGFGSGPGF